MKKFTLALGIMLSMASSAFAQIGSLATDLVYTPITPCRVLDTRPSQGGSGAIGAAGTKNFQIWGATSYAAQGGKASDCGITAGSDVAAVAMNFTVVTPAAGGFITAYPFGAALPVAATVNFQAGDIARGDFTIAKVAQTGTSHLSIYSTSLADVVGDVVGYYARPVATALQCVEVSGLAVNLAANTDAGFSAPTCTAGYTLVGLNVAASLAGMLKMDGTRSFTYVRNSTSNVMSVTPISICCRISGR